MVQMAQQMSPLKTGTPSKETTTRLLDNARSAARNLTEKLDNAADDHQVTRDPETDTSAADENGNTPVHNKTDPPANAKIILSPLKFHMSDPILTSPVKKTLRSPAKARPIPCFQKFHDLAFDDETIPLQLPQKYKLLVDTFNCMDRVISLLMQQKQLTSFDRIRSSVERMSGRRFDMKKLLQLKTILPHSFIFKYDSSVSSKQSATTQLTKTLVIIPTRCKESAGDSNLIPVELKPSVIVSRKKEMHQKLMEFTKREHDKFLRSLEPPIIVDNTERLHSHFPLEEVPDIIADDSLMPVNPHKREDQTVDIVLQRIGHADRKCDVTVAPVTASKAETPCHSGGIVTSGDLKGLRIDFVEKIRAKEAARIARDLTRSPESEKKITMLRQSLPLIRTLRSYFVGEAKTTLPTDSVIRKVIESSSSYISYEEVDERLVCLTKVLPDWIMILKIKKGTYVKLLDRNRKLVDLEKVIQKLIDETLRKDHSDSTV
jgi:chromatin licensing and DNA replication factor 1